MPALNAAGLSVLKEVEHRRAARLASASQLSESTSSAQKQLKAMQATPLSPAATPRATRASSRRPAATDTTSANAGVATRARALLTRVLHSPEGDAEEEETEGRRRRSSEGEQSSLRKQLAASQREAASARAEASALRSLLLAKGLCNSVAETPARGRAPSGDAAAAAAARVPLAQPQSPSPRHPVEDAPFSPGSPFPEGGVLSTATALGHTHSRLRALLLWEKPVRSAKVGLGAAYALGCCKWAEEFHSLSPISAIAWAALCYLAWAFVRRRAALVLGRQPPPPPVPLVEREAAVREAAMSVCAHAAAAASRAAPLLAELWAAGAQLLSGEAPHVTLRVSMALWAAARAASLLAPISPSSLALGALGAAFTLPLLRSMLHRELALVWASAQHVWETRLGPALLPPPSARPPAAAALAWLVWRYSRGATRAFLLFLAVVHGTDVLGAWALSIQLPQGQGMRSPRGPPITRCTLQELEDEDE